jgi:hypothetical protein
VSVHKSAYLGFKKAKKIKTESSWMKSASRFALLDKKSLLKGCFQKHFCS